MNKVEARYVIQELLRRKEARQPLPTINWKSFVSDEQWLIIVNECKAKVLCCARRLGKTEGAAIALLKTAYENQGTQCLYLALTRKSAKSIIWRTLKKTAKKYNIPHVAAASELSLTIGTSIIYVTGADTEGIADKLRGQAYKLIVIDEIGSFRSDLRYLIDDILWPTLMDYDGAMLIQGTPPPTWEDDDLFYEAWHKPDKGWEKFTITKNPFMSHRDKWIENLRKRQGWSLTHPTYLREYCNQWVKDTESLVWRFDSGRNKYSALPEGLHPEYVLGIDLGFVDATAFVVLAVYPTIKKIFAVDCYQRTGMIVTDIAMEIKLLTNKYKPVITVADTGGGGRTVVEELNQVHGLSVRAADKTNKKGYIELVNSSFIQGQFFIEEHLIGLINELMTLQWDSTKKKDIATGADDHRSHAMLYGFREAARLISPLSGEIVEVSDKTKEQQYEEAMEQFAVDQYNKEQIDKNEILGDKDDDWGIFGNS